MEPENYFVVAGVFVAAETFLLIRCKKAKEVISLAYIFQTIEVGQKRTKSNILNLTKAISFYIRRRRIWRIWQGSIGLLTCSSILTLAEIWRAFNAHVS
jgi:hypothetical protein